MISSIFIVMFLSCYIIIIIINFGLFLELYYCVFFR